MSLVIWWCENHEASGNQDWCLQTLIVEQKPWDECRMVRLTLVSAA